MTSSWMLQLPGLWWRPSWPELLLMRSSCRLFCEVLHLSPSTCPTCVVSEPTAVVIVPQTVLRFVFMKGQTPVAADRPRLLKPLCYMGCLPVSDPVIVRLGGEMVDGARRLLSRDHVLSRLERVWGPGDGRSVHELKVAIDQLLDEYLLSRQAHLRYTKHSSRAPGCE